MLRHLLQRQRAGRRHHALLVDGDAFELGDIPSRWRYDRLGVERLRLAVVAL